MYQSMLNLIEKGDLSEITTYQAGIIQAASHRSLQKHCDTILEPYGISKAQWLIIGAIKDAGKDGIRISDLAASLGTNVPFMTNSTLKLDKMGIVDRKNNKDDSRSKLIFLHKDFAPKCAEIETALRNGLRKSIYKNIDPAEFKIYIKVLFQLYLVDVSEDK